MKRKLNFFVLGGLSPRSIQILRVMKLSIFLLSFSLVSAFASNTYSQSKKLTLKMENTTVKEVLSNIENQSEFYFMYSQKVIDADRQVSVNVKNRRITSILKELFAGTNVGYTVQDRIIVLTTPEIAGSITSFYQEQTPIHGRVVDFDGEPIPGATVVIQGTTIGTITDAEGNYTIDDIPTDAVLIFSFIGYISETVSVNDQTEINMSLINDLYSLQEIVVVGYGSVKKSELTGSISQVGTKDFEHVPIQRIEEALQGRASGVSVTSLTGSPAGGIRIRVRGANSINGGNDPLYVIDGITDNFLFTSLDVQDIASIEVLKDASATAIYGSRGANGVILITTKKGRKKDFSLNFETQQSLATIGKQYDMLSSSDYAKFYNEVTRGQGSSEDYFTPEEIKGFENGAGTDWQDLMFNNAYSQNYKLSMSGGSDKVDYIIGGTVRKAEGILVGSNYDKYTVRANVNADATDWFDINFAVNSSFDKSYNNSEDSENQGSTVMTALSYSPTLSLYDESGNWISDNINSVRDNPYGVRIQDKKDRSRKYFSGSTKLNFIIPIEGLTFSTLGYASYRDDRDFALNSKDKNLHSQNFASNKSSEYSVMQNTNILTYDKTIGNHKITATGVAEYNMAIGTELEVSAADLLTESVGYWNVGLGTVNGFGNSYRKSTLASYVGRVSYQYNSKYLLTATIRRDGSSKFQGDNKWGNFPSVALAWRASEESFIKDLNVFNQFKVRASYGVTGNQAIDAYSTLGLLSESNHGWGSSTIYPGYWAKDVPTPDLTWEKTYQSNIGVDFGFFSNRLRASFDIYKKETKDLLLKKSIPKYNGGGTVYRNLGVVENTGYDIDLGFDPISNDIVRWSSSINISYSKNIVTDLGGEERLFVGARNNTIGFQSYVLEEGAAMGSLWGYTWLGLWKTEEAEEAALYGQQPGDNHFLDVDGNHEINSDDQSIIGKAFPDYMFGWNNTISVKNFDFNIFFQGVTGADRLNLTRYSMSEAISDSKFVTSVEGRDNMWTPDNQDTNIPNIYSLSVNSQAGSTQYLESADFVRLKNLSVAYNIKLDNVEQISNLRISCSVQNLFTITSYSGYDPEVTSSGSDTKNGIESGAYPMARTYTLGLQMTF